MNSKKSIGIRLSKALNASGKLQKDLAKHLGVTDNTVSYYCSGTRIPSTLQIIEISKFLNVSTDYLLFGTDNYVCETVFEDNNFFAVNLRKLISENNTTIKAVADNIGITRQAVSQYCDGHTQPNADNIIKIAKFFNVSANYLLGMPDKGISETNIKLHACDDLGISCKAYEQIKAILKSINDDMKDICLEMINMISRKIEDNSNG